MKNVIVLAVLAVVLAGCSAPGGWQGMEAEKAYDKQLEAARLTQVINNDDYYEIHKDGRIYVLSSVPDLKTYLSTGEIPLRVTRIAGGPKGETLVFGIAKPEASKKSGFGSVEMYDGRRTGADKDFYAEVYQGDKWYVFGSWAALDSFRKTGKAEGLSAAGGSSAGEAVVVAQPVEALATRFHSVHGTGTPIVAKPEAPAKVERPAPVAAPAASAKPDASKAPAKPKKKKAAAPATQAKKPAAKKADDKAAVAPKPDATKPQ